MSRIGNLPIKVPENVEIIIEKTEQSKNPVSITVKGKFGTLKKEIPQCLELVQAEGNNTLLVLQKQQTPTTKAKHGLHRTLINNMIIGVSEQFHKKLILNGIGYKANLQKKSIVLNLGYSHPVDIEIPDIISIKIEKNTTVIISSCDKEKLGLFAAKIRSWRVPEPYKGKGVLYENEIVKLKAGKSGKK